jgi:hypothetical protein
MNQCNAAGAIVHLVRNRDRTIDAVRALHCANEWFGVSRAPNLGPLRVLGFCACSRRRVAEAAAGCIVSVCQMFWVLCVASQRGRSMNDDDDTGSLSMSVKTTPTLVTVVGPGCWTRLVDLGAADSSLGRR